MQKVTCQISLEKFLGLLKVKILFLVHKLLVILIMKKYFGCFTKKNCKKQIKNNLEKIMKRKGDKLYVNWKGYDNSFKSWIDKNDIVI